MGFSLGTLQSCRATPAWHGRNHGNQEPGLFSELVPQDRLGPSLQTAPGRGHRATAPWARGGRRCTSPGRGGAHARPSEEPTRRS